MKSTIRLSAEIRLLLTSLAHKETIKVLNLHATVRANRDRTGTNEFYEKFSDFIQALKRSDPTVDFLTADPTDTTRMAYSSLRNCQVYTDGNKGLL